MAVSVLITTKDREDFLKFVLGRLSPQFRLGDELVIVDDGSEAPLAADMVATWVGPDVPLQLLRNDESRGLIRARNQGLRAARGEFVLQLDDDSWPVGVGVFDRVEEAMKLYPRAGALAFPIHEHWSGGEQEVGSLYPRCRLPDGIRDFAFIGCGVGLRRDVVLDAGGYPEYGTYGSEEEALGLRMWRIGMEIRVCHAVRVIHGHEALSSRAEYRATRQNAAHVELASNRLCCYRESLPMPVWCAMSVAGILSFGIRRRAAGIPSLFRACRAKRPMHRRGIELSLGQASRWILCRSAVFVRLRFSPSRY